MLSFSDPISKIPNLKSFHIKRLAHLDINTVEDLLYHFPHRYDDFSKFKKIAQLQPEETVSIRGKINSIKSIRTYRKKMTITEVVVEDDTSRIKAVWFNRPFPLRFLSEGKFVELSGKISTNKKQETYFQHPNFQLIPKYDFAQNPKINSNNTSTGALTAIYPETQGVTSYFFRRIIKNVLSKTKITESLPPEIINRQNLPTLRSSLQEIHFPKTIELANIARTRFAFEKMFILQLNSLIAKAKWDKNKSVNIPFDEKFIKKFVFSLPFKLTPAQKKSAWQIILDLESGSPMNRLLEGDVGSGKTIVAAVAMLSAANKGFQSVLLAPTEVLATQHYQTLLPHFKDKKFDCGLLTKDSSKINNQKTKKGILKKKLESGKLPIVIGTHALLQESVSFKIFHSQLLTNNIVLESNKEHICSIKQQKSMTVFQKLFLTYSQ